MNLTDIQRRLQAPFSQHQIDWAADRRNADGTRALMRPSVGARAVQDRLDAICPNDWHLNLTVLPTPGAVLAQLTVCGCRRDAIGAADTLPAAASAALVTAAAHFGVGRYLTDVTPAWCDYDAAKDQATPPPALPEWARPEFERSPGGSHMVNALEQLRYDLPVDLDLQREVYKHIRAALAALPTGTLK